MERPRWAVKNDDSIRSEVEPYRGMTQEERARDLRRACRAAVRLLAARPDRERVLAHVDPLPESSRRALARLRAQASGRG